MFRFSKKLLTWLRRFKSERPQNLKVTNNDSTGLSPSAMLCHVGTANHILKGNLSHFILFSPGFQLKPGLTSLY